MIVRLVRAGAMGALAKPSMVLSGRPHSGAFRAQVEPTLQSVGLGLDAARVWLPHRVDVRLSGGGRLRIGRLSKGPRYEGGWRVCLVRGVGGLGLGAVTWVDDTDSSPAALLELLRAILPVPGRGC